MFQIKNNKLRIKSLMAQECYRVNLCKLKTHPLSFFPTKKIFEQRWNPITWKFIWELYVSFPTLLKAEEFSREARKISDAPREIWLGSMFTCLTTNAWVSPRVMCGDERSLIYKLERRIPPPSVLRKIKQYKVNLEEWAVTAELGKRNEKENWVGHVFALHIKTRWRKTGALDWNANFRWIMVDILALFTLISRCLL